MVSEPGHPVLTNSNSDNPSTVIRSYDWEDLEFIVEKYSGEFINFDAKKIVEDEDNILLRNNKMDYGLFEYDEDGVYFGHYMFRSRGFENTVASAREILNHFFNNYNVNLIIGLTPVWHKGALKLNEALGLEKLSSVTLPHGIYNIVTLTKDTFRNE